MDPLDIAKGIAKEIARTGLGPVLGPLLAGLFENGRKQLLAQRLDEFLEELRTEFTSVLENEFDKQYLESQDYAHLILLAVNHALRTRTREKRKVYARALRNAGSKEWGFTRCDIAEELLNALADLSPMEIRILQAGWSYLTGHPPKKPPPTVLDRTFRAEDIAASVADLGINEPEIRAYLSKLQRLGFTEELVGGMVGYSGGTFRLTPLVDRLMKLIQP